MIETATYCVSVLARVCEHYILKILIATGFVGFHFLFDDALEVEMIALFFLILADFLFAIAHAYKDPDNYIQSRKIIRTAYKFILYFGLVATAHITELALPDLFILEGIDETIIAFLAVTEMISILEHASNFGFDIPKKLLGRLKVFRDSK